jgi:hypothetical protein
LVASDVESGPKSEEPGMPVTDVEPLRCKEDLYGGRAEKEDMVKPWKVVEFAEVALLPSIVPRNTVFVEELAPDDVVAVGQPAVELAAPEPDVRLLATIDPVVVDETAAEGGSVAGP